MSDEQWDNDWVRSLGMQLTGGSLDVRDEQGNAIQDDTLLLLLNAHHEPVTFTLPPAPIEAVGDGVVDVPRNPPEHGSCSWIPPRPTLTKTRHSRRATRMSCNRAR